MDCLKKIYVAEAISQIKKIVSIKIFNEKTLLSKVDQLGYLLVIFKFLKKEDIIKNFGNNNDFYVFNDKEDLEDYDNIYSKFLNEKTSDAENIPDNGSELISDKPIKNKICKVCGLDLDSSNFCKNDSSQDGFSIKCKKCSRKSYAVTALEKIEDYVELDIPFKKDDILNQVPNRTQFLDYIWTLQEFNLLIEDEQLNTYILKPQKELTEFIKKYGNKIEEVLIKTESTPSKKLTNQKSS